MEDLNKTDDNFTNGIVSEVKEGIELLKVELVKFLRDAKQDIDSLCPAYRIFAAILGASGENSKELVISLLERKNVNGTWEFPNNKIISFNYLDDPSSISFYLQFFIDKK